MIDCSPLREPQLVGTTPPSLSEFLHPRPTTPHQTSNYFKSTQWYSPFSATLTLLSRTDTHQVPRRHHPPNPPRRQHPAHLHRPTHPSLPTPPPHPLTLHHAPPPRTHLRQRLPPLLHPRRTIHMPHPRLPALSSPATDLPLRARHTGIISSSLPNYRSVYSAALDCLQSRQPKSFLGGIG